jgi:hypothetical protein
VDFPLWVKAVAGLFTILMPITILLGAWVGSQIFDISLKVARIETRLDDVPLQKATATEALAKATLLDQRVARTEQDIAALKTQAGLN